MGKALETEKPAPFISIASYCPTRSNSCEGGETNKGVRVCVFVFRVNCGDWYDYTPPTVETQSTVDIPS